MRSGLLIVSWFVPGFYRQGVHCRAHRGVVIGLVNATLGLFLKIVTFPLTIVTLGIFWLVINALMLILASKLLSPNFVVAGFWPAFIGAIVLALVNMLLKGIAREVEN